jgi:uncharacterized protein YdaU (DUF1376 family)
MNAPPAFLFYPKDYLADVNVVLMPLETEAAYWRLICHCWIEGSLPNDPARLAVLVRLTPEAFAARIWPAIAACFTVDDAGRLRHPRLERERAKLTNAKRRRQQAALARWDRAG